MNGFFDIYSVIFLVIAVVIFLRLRSVLGKRTGTERPPFDPYARREAPPADGGDKVIQLPRPADRAAPAMEPGEDTAVRVRAYAADGSALSDALKAVIARDRDFDPKTFLDGARRAYEMIVTAYAEGDRKMLKQLLSREVLDGFAAAIGQREDRRETVEFKFVGIDKADISEAALRGNQAQITVRFLSSIVTATRNAAGEVIDGDPGHVAEVTDVWTFARDLSSRDPNWKLVATESVE